MASLRSIALATTYWLQYASAHRFLARLPLSSCEQPAACLSPLLIRLSKVDYFPARLAFQLPPELTFPSMTLPFTRPVYWFAPAVKLI